MLQDSERLNTALRRKKEQIDKLFQEKEKRGQSLEELEERIVALS
jgi:hypothetical protein